MNESTSTNPSPDSTVFRHILALKYIMAGDLESVDLLEQLEARRIAIRWDDPAFINFTEEMRTGVPKLTTDQESLLEPSPRAMIHALIGKLADSNESAASLLPIVKQIDEVLQKDREALRSVLKMGQALVNQRNKMAAKLELLGADMTEFEISLEDDAT